MPRNISSTPKRRGRPRKEPLPTDNVDGGVVQGEDTRQEQQILVEVKDRFDALREFAHGIANGQVQSLIVSGAPGIGKTFTLDSVISEYKRKNKVKKFAVVKGFMTAAMLYRLLYENREKGNVVFLDDCDAIFWNEDALNILKAALDTVEHRIVSYRAMGDDDEIPTEFEFKATMVFATNIDFHHYIKVAKNRIVEHLKALMSRCQYLPMKLHHPRSVVIWVRHLIRDNKILTGHPHGITMPQSEEILEYLMSHHDRIPYLSLRTAVKAVELVKLNPQGWRRLADFTLLKQD